MSQYSLYLFTTSEVVSRVPGFQGFVLNPRKLRFAIGMDLSEYARYGRQMLVPEVGLPGQLAMRSTKVLVVGAGGLGCPAIAYLAGAGVGELGIVDPDVVETSNLHRQILHHQLGLPKAESAAKYVADLNPMIKTHVFCEAFSTENAMQIVDQFDIVLDCTDTPKSRYLINDACVLANKPLVSASALKTEGQLAVYHHKGGPCYRCLFPKPPPPHLVTACGDGGIIGPVVGIMGVHQAIEALKIILDAEFTACLTLFSMFSFPQWRAMRIRGRQNNCAVCGDTPSITSLLSCDYEEFCGGPNPISGSDHRISAVEFANMKDQNTVLDVRPTTQFGICNISGSINVPIDALRRIKSKTELPFDTESPVLVVCRYGNDSQEAVNRLKEWGITAHDVAGGLHSWSSVDKTFPRY